MNDPWDKLIDDEWLALTQEQVVDPELPIVDPHHHLWDWPFAYEAADLIRDMRDGHNVVGTVYAEAGRGYREDGPEHLKPAGETAYMLAVSEESEKADPRIRLCAGIIGACELTADPSLIGELLDAHVAAGKGRFSGIRSNVFISFTMPELNMYALPGWDDISNNADYLAGAAVLARKGLVLDIVNAHFQLAEIARLARNLPDLTIVLNHLAVPAALAGTASGGDLFDEWRRAIDVVAELPNVHMKLGGLANPMMCASLPDIRELRAQTAPATSERLAEIYRPMVSHAIDRFGPARCMFESNFPVDKWATSYRVLWNAFKRLARPYSADGQADLFMGTAARVYKLENLPGQLPG